ncbi:MAG: hypothetical protein JXA41_15030 [Deltaproteobacteria bacterium]|nr:hypothetical protein [Deltaproteobacteria bacterium]
MRKNLSIFIVFVIVGCVGCRSIDVKRSYIHHPTTEYKSFYHHDKNYKLGDKKTVFIGQAMIQVTEYKVKQSIPITILEKVISPERFYVQFTHRIYNYKIVSEKNDEFPLDERIALDGKTYYLIDMLDNYGTRWGMVINNSGEINMQGLFSYYYNKFYNLETLTIEPSEFKFLTYQGTTAMETQATKRITYELLYSGNNNTALNITYREFTGDDIARPAFYQVITYSANAEQIRFKDFFIKIHSADNEKITYTVIADGLK